MRNDVTTNDAKAAAALAHGIQETDANLNLCYAPTAGVSSYEAPSLFHDLNRDLSDGFPPQSLHEQIVVASLASSLWSQRRYARFETGLLNAHLLENWDQTAPGTPDSAPARRLLHAFQSFTDRERSTFRTLLGLEDRLHQISRANADRLTRAARARQAAAGRSARKGN
ncbi:MAG: hypothetical protein QM757_29050 [Paludibaculum sp.]